MRYTSFAAVVIGIFTLVLPVRAADVASAPAGEIDVSACLADPPGLAAQLEVRLAELNRAVEAADTPLDRATAHLAVANWLLGVPTARPAVRWLLGSDRGDDLRSIAARAGQAREHIEKARAALKSASDQRSGLGQTSAGDPKGAAGRKVAELKLAADSLEPFVKLFAAADPGLDAARRKSAFAEAALGMAIARESDKPEQSACALLWQSFAWECAGRRERAMVSLPAGLVKPEQPDFDYLSRLLRCRLVAEDGRHPSAFALAMRIRALGDQWFAGESPERLAARRRLAAVVQYQIGRAWLGELRQSKSQAAAADLEAMLAGLRDVLYDKNEPGLIRFPDRVVPILLHPPSAAATGPASMPASAPASRPSSAPASSGFLDE